MGFKIKSGKSAGVKSGIYPAVVFELRNRKTRYGPATLIEFEITSENENGIHIDGYFPGTITPKNKFGRMLQNMGIDPDLADGLDSDDLKGRPVLIRVGPTQGIRYSFQGVRDTVPFEKTKAEVIS